MIHSKEIDFNKLVEGDLFTFLVVGSMVVIEDGTIGPGLRLQKLESCTVRSISLMPLPEDPIQDPMPIEWDRICDANQKDIIKGILGQLDIHAAY